MTAPSSPPARRTSRFRFLRGLEGAVFVLALLVGGTLVAWRYATERSLEVQRSRFHAEASQLTETISQQLDLFLDALRGLQGLYAASKAVERDEFAAYVRQTDFLARHPEAWAVWFVARVQADEREAFEARVRADTSLRLEGYPDFVIHPAGERAELFVTTYWHPMDERLIGLDLAADPGRREALEQARDSGEPVATGRLALLSDPSRAGIFLALPIYQNGAPTASVEERRRALVGFVASVVDTEELFRTARQLTQLCPGVTLSVSEESRGAEGQPARTPELLYRFPEAAGLTGRTTAVPLRGLTTLVVGERIWVCEFTARPGCPFLKPGDRTPLLVLVLGLAFSLLGFGILASLATSRLRAMKLAESMTQAWRTNQELLMVRTNQQTAVAELSQQALTDIDLSTFFDCAGSLVAKTLHVELCELLELLPDGTALQLRAGVGWQPGRVGQAMVQAGPGSQAGYALQTGGPVIVEDFRTETRLTGPALLREHGAVSGMSVVITGPERPFGVLGAYTTSLRRFSEDDVQFLQNIANVLAAVVHRKHLEGQLRQRSAALEQNNVSLMRQQTVMQSLLEDLQTSKDRLETQRGSLEAARGQLELSLAELQSTQLQLIQSEKLESVGRLAAGVAHEVKNPLAIILMGAEYLAKHVTDGDEATGGVLKDMEEAVKRADRVIKGLLDFSAWRELEMEPHALPPVIEQSLLLVKHALMKARVDAVTQFAKDLPPLALDRQKMEQVFVNLFTNAVHAMPEGGTLTVTAEVRAARGDAVVVTVDDTGTGIPPEKLFKVFDPFFTTKPTGQGTGLGLTVVRKIIELHGGTIDVANRPEGGARVTVLLPVTRKA